MENAIISIMTGSRMLKSDRASKDVPNICEKRWKPPLTLSERNIARLSSNGRKNTARSRKPRISGEVVTFTDLNHFDARTSVSSAYQKPCIRPKTQKVHSAPCHRPMIWKLISIGNHRLRRCAGNGASRLNMA